MRYMEKAYDDARAARRVDPLGGVGPDHGRHPHSRNRAGVEAALLQHRADQEGVVHAALQPILGPGIDIDANEQRAVLGRPWFGGRRSDIIPDDRAILRDDHHAVCLRRRRLVRGRPPDQGVERPDRGLHRPAAVPR